LREYIRDYIKDKRAIYLSSCLIILLIIAIGLVILLSSAKKGLERLSTQYNEMGFLRDEFLVLKNRIDTVEKRKKLTKINGIIPALDDVVSSLGLKVRIKSIKPVGNREALNSIEEDAEVSVEKLSMNEMVNLFYKIENAPMLLILKRADIKTSFEKPDLMNLTLAISLVHEK